MVKINFKKSNDEINFKRVFENYSEITGEMDNEGNIFVKCPLPSHSDTDPSCSINIHTGMWHCFGCGAGGDVFDLIKEIEDVDFKRAKAIVKTLNIEPVQETLVKEWIHKFNRSKKHKKFWFDKRGISDRALTRYQIGWDGSRYTIPILNTNGDVVNVRRYDPNSKGSKKVVSYKSGYGSPRLFPIYNLKFKRIWIVEGETDCLLANDIGLRTITSTGGALSWQSNWAKQFKDKEICICYDTDTAGVQGASKCARSLYGIASNVKIIELPLKINGSKDLTDYITKEKGTKRKLENIAKNTDEWQPSVKDQEITDKELPEVHLSEASQARFSHKKIKTTAIVAGKLLSPYIVPKKVVFTCTPDEGNKQCAKCPMNTEEGGRKEIEIGGNSKWILELVNVPDSVQFAILSSFSGVGKCKNLEMKVIKEQNIVEITMIPEIDFSSIDKEYCVRQGFYIGHNINTNRTYTFEGLALPHPKNQSAVLLIDKAKPAQNDLNTFEVTSAIKKQLQVFQLKKRRTIEQKLNEIHSDLVANVTGIYGRDDLIMCADLVFHSVLGFKFQNRLVPRGWVEALILGDSRTGKTETVQSLVKHYRNGEFITGENTSKAGLIGGLQQFHGKWMITWGKIPLNNGRMVVIDEASALSEDEIADMSGVRSSGLAEITKIQTERTDARTRLLWMSNPRSTRTLGTYTYGVLAIKELIGRPEDIARFDCALTVANNEISMDLINKEKRNRVKHVYTSELSRLLVMWVWSRKPKDVEFDSGTEKFILESAIEMGSMYTAKIPLVEGADQRIKLARMSISLAARLYSTDSTGTKVIVKKQHVEYIVKFLNMIYEKNSLRYKQFSDMELRAEREIDSNISDISEWMQDNPDFIRQMHVTHQFKMNELAELIGMEPFEVREHISFLARMNLLIRTPGGYVKSSQFVSLIHKFIANPPGKKRGRKKKSKF